jgi:thiol-disulfide isomerase/thioredoxin
MFRHLLIAMFVLMPASVIAGDRPALELEQYRGQVVYLDFWASWCVPCRRSFPWMNEMHSRYSGDGLVILAVNVDGERQDAEKFLEALPADFRIVFDPEGRLAAEWQLLGMPNSFLISRNGEVVARHVGFRSDTPGKLEEEIREQLRAGKTQIREVVQ